MITLVTGSNGQLGACFRRHCAGDPGYIFADRTRLNLLDSEGIMPVLDQIRPDVIINCAAYTDVNEAENNAELANQVNALAVDRMARWTAANGSVLIHFSTDYVFDGLSNYAYCETDTVRPLSVYGKSKAEGEALFLASGTAGACLRTSWLHSVTGHNFFVKMCRLLADRQSVSVVDDQNGVPTTTDFLVDVTCRLLAAGRNTGNTFPLIMHAVPCGSTSWFGFAKHIKRRLIEQGVSTLAKLEPVSSEFFPQRAMRPANSRLANETLANTLEISLGEWSGWHDALYGEK